MGYSTYIPNNHPRVLECLIGGVVADKIQCDLSNIKCPICGEIMRISQLSDSDYINGIEDRLVARRNCGCVYSVECAHTFLVGFTCPSCLSTLNVKATDVVQYGKLIK